MSEKYRPPKMDFAQSQQLRQAVLDAAKAYGASQGLPLEVLTMELGFQCAALAGAAGVLDKKYEEWLHDRHATTGAEVADAGGPAPGPDPGPAPALDAKFDPSDA